MLIIDIHSEYKSQMLAGVSGFFDQRKRDVSRYMLCGVAQFGIPPLKTELRAVSVFSAINQHCSW